MSRTGIVFLVAAMALTLAVSVSAAPITVNVPLADGWNLFALPAVPIDPAPDSVFTGSGISLNNRLYRFDSTAGYIGYNIFTPEEFGNMLIGDGYWVSNTTGATKNVSYQGVDVSGDHWISLPTAGYNLVGYPNMTPTSVPFDDLLVTNGIETKTMAAAITANWVGNRAFRFDPLGGNVSVGLSTNFFVDEYDLMQNFGYWFESKIDNLALIIPGGA